jgi:hypothetical protein
MERQCLRITFREMNPFVLIKHFREIADIGNMKLDEISRELEIFINMLELR